MEEVVAGNNGHPGQSVIAKVAAILGAFTGERVQLSLSDLCRATGLPTSTVHRLAQELIGLGVLERSRDRRYMVGARPWELAARASRVSVLREAALPYMHDLHHATRQHVQLAVADGDQALLVEKISGLGAIPTVGRAGGRLPLHASGVGKAILAHSSPAVQDRIVTGVLVRYTPKTLTSPDALRTALAEVRRVGHATCDEELTLGAVSCAAPVFGPRSAMVAAVSVVGPASSGALHEMAAAVRTIAHGISRALHAMPASRPVGGMSPLSHLLVGGALR
ncbi:IclR family transcriptional regulator [Nonomuraea sp. FMUSA5-5]|uniref:IclR family transcriptional regulator n=1 Tax=Nonomuraea composti TaxID=2720023 RepID=A0ABX1BHS9_9ACTN|nr:IclR family transcriptional regulator [Nonomuraea sp. FMUSA5-5]